MINQLHQNMISKGGWYARWHQDPVHSRIHWAGFLFIAVITAFMFQTSFAQAPSYPPETGIIMVQTDSPTTQSVLIMTAQMLNTNQDHRKASLDRKDLTYADLLEAVKQRRNALASLIKTNPKGALETSLTSSQQSVLPSGVAGLLEHAVVVEGQVQEFHSDDFANERSEHLYYLVDSKSGQQFGLFFAKPQTQVLGGKIVKVNGVQLDKNIAVSDSKVISKASKSLATILGTATVKKVAVILFNFTDDTRKPYSTDAIRNTMFTADPQSAHAYYLENSFGQWDIQGKDRTDGDVYDWVTIPYDSPTDYPTCRSNLLNWAAAADAAAAGQGFDRSGYDVTMYEFPYTANCPFSGSAYLGTPYSYINGNFTPYVISHEMGHDFYLSHAASFLCYDDLNNRVTLSNRCNISEYGDPFDTMGGAPTLRHFNDRKKGQTLITYISPNWLAPENKFIVTTSGTYTVNPIEQSSTGIQSLQIPRVFTYYDQNGNLQTVNEGFYFIEYRRPFGYDNFAPGDPVVNGVTVRLSNALHLFPLQSLLLDMVPSTSTFTDAPLLLGKTFTDTDTGISISVISLGASAATVRITIPSTVCVQENPSISLAPSTQSGTAGTTLSYTLTVTNNDTAPCSPATFDLTPVLPTNWTQTPSTMSEVITPGNSVVKTILVTSPGDATPGTYAINETTHNIASPAFSASTSASYVIPQPIGDGKAPVVAITNPPDGTIYNANVTVKVTSTASDGDGIQSIQIAVDAKILGTCTGVPTCIANLLTKTLSVGSHTLTATATDNSGVKNSASITIKKVRGKK